MSGGSISSNTKPTADAWHVYTSFASQIDLTDGSQGPKGVFARALHVMSTGTLVVKRADGSTETITGCFAGLQIVGACSTIETGTTATQVIAYW